MISAFFPSASATVLLTSPPRALHRRGLYLFTNLYCDLPINVPPRLCRVDREWGERTETNEANGTDDKIIRWIVE